MKFLVSRRNFIVITMMMVVLFGLFQFSLVMKDRGNRYDVNDFVTDSTWDSESVYLPQVRLYGAEAPDGNYVAFIGKSSGDVYNTVEQWCTYSKRNLMVYPSVSDYSHIRENPPQAILIDGEQINPKTDTNKLKFISMAHVPMIFCTMPDVRDIMLDPDLMMFFGIDMIMAESVDIVGVHVFPQFLLGGEIMYQVVHEEDEKRMDLDLTIPWYHTFNGTKSYIIGMFEEHPEDTDILPSLVWRYSTSDNQIFVVCGDFIKDVSGMGYLEAMMAELSDYDIYPVVNAQNFSIVNFPVLTNENSGKMSEIYSRSMLALDRDLLWPNLISVMEGSHFVPTCFITPQFTYQGDKKPSGDELIFYLKQIKEQNAEAGISMETKDEGILAEKVKEDSKFFSDMHNEYIYSAIYAQTKDLKGLEGLFTDELFSGVHTVVTDKSTDKPLFGYFNENVTIQQTTQDAFNYKYSDDLKLKGYETALGYCNVLLDMTDVLWPETEDDEWQKRSEVFSSNVMTFWKPFQLFERTTVSESDLRLRRFLALNYTDIREEDEDTIYVTIENFDETAYFILRTHNEQIAAMDGGTYTKLETGAYLIEAYEPEFSISLITPSHHDVVE